MENHFIHKYLSGEATEAETRQLFDWIEASEENRQLFMKLKKAWVFTGTSGEAYQTSWKKLQQQIPFSPAGRKFPLWKYAAVLVVLLGVAAMLQLRRGAEELSSPGIVLETEKAAPQILVPGQEKKILDEKGEIVAEVGANEITYHQRATKAEPKIHRITVPNAEKFKVQLADGTVVQLNAGSSLRFPEQFTGNTRQVFLTGEAYFEVAHNKEQAFIVNTKEIDIRVLGTKFNLSVYPEDEAVETVLTEGSVQVTQANEPSKKLLLKPGFKAVWHKKTNTFSSKKVNTDQYLAWMRGELIFEDASCADIFKKLERQYDVKIENDYEFLAKQTYTGSFDIEQIELLEILELLQLDTPFEYKREGAVIRISKPRI